MRATLLALAATATIICGCHTPQFLRESPDVSRIVYANVNPVLPGTVKLVDTYSKTWTHVVDLTVHSHESDTKAADEAFDRLKLGAANLGTNRIYICNSRITPGLSYWLSARCWRDYGTARPAAAAAKP